MARLVFKVLRMNPDIQTHVKKHPVYEKGEFVGARDEEIMFQTGLATDGATFQGELCEYTFTAPPGYVHTGDTILADNTAGLEILNVFVESGVNATAPVKHVPVPVASFNPNADENMPLLYPDGARSRLRTWTHCFASKRS